MKIKTIARAAAAFLTAGLLLSSLCSCQWVYVTYDGTPGTAATAAAQQTRDLSQLPETAAPAEGKKYSDLGTGYSEAVEAAKNLYAQNYKDATFMVIVAEEASNTLSADENDALYYPYAMREKLITDVYYNSFYISKTPYINLKNDLSASVKSGQSVGNYYADMLELPAGGAATLATSGLLLNLRNLPFYTVQQEGVEGSGYSGGKSYFNAGTATEALTDTLCLYFNRTACGEEMSAELYSAALDGSFTFEKFLTLAASCKAGTAGRTGFCSETEYLGDLAFVRSGLSFTVTASSYKEINTALGNTAELDGLIDRLLSLGVKASAVKTVSSAIDSSAVITASDNSARDAFAAVDCPFYIGTVSDAETLYTAKTHWGLLPLPAEEGCSVRIEKNRSVFCIPANNSRLEMTGLMLTALDTLPDEWMSDFIYAEYAEKYLRDNSSCATLIKVLEGDSFCDFAYLYGDSVNGLASATWGAVRGKASGILESVSSSGVDIAAVNKAIKKLN